MMRGARCQHPRIVDTELYMMFPPTTTKSTLFPPKNLSLFLTMNMKEFEKIFLQNSIKIIFIQNSFLKSVWWPS
jgi:hypothetical protein